MAKIRVAIIFGGRSAEHEVSLQSARNVIESIDKSKYDVVLIGIDREGRWYLNDSSKPLLNYTDPKLSLLNKSNEIALVSTDKPGQLISIPNKQDAGQVDVVFPVLHGPFGEDGTIQGLLKLMNIPYVGAGVLGSAIGMDKEVAKRLLKEAGLPIAKFIALKNPSKIGFDEVKNKLGLPFFIKPANLGSSVGIHKVHDKEEFEKATSDAFEYDNKVLAEEFVKGREIECSVLGNENPIASLPGEIITGKDHEFYSYEAKYVDENGAILEIPAKLTKEEIDKIQKLAIQTFKVLCCEGMGRVDFFLKENGEVIVNEINTIPGFTKISMYSKLWEVSGISCKELIDRLITLAIERFQRDRRLKTSTG